MANPEQLLAFIERIERLEQEKQEVIERIERLEQEKQEVIEYIKHVYKDAKFVGYDPAIIRRVVDLRKLEPDDRQAYQTKIKMYLEALEEALPF